jgi:adenylate cyclase
MTPDGPRFKPVPFLGSDPDNVNMKYNFACMLILDLHDYEAGLDLLEPVFARARPEIMRWMKTDPDLDAVRDHPRFRAMLAAADARLSQSPP